MEDKRWTGSRENRRLRLRILTLLLLSGWAPEKYFSTMSNKTQKQNDLHTGLLIAQGNQNSALNAPTRTDGSKYATVQSSSAGLPLRCEPNVPVRIPKESLL